MTADRQQLSPAQSALLQRLSVMVDGQPFPVPASELSSELLVGSTELVTDGFIEIGIGTAGAVTFAITDRGIEYRGQEPSA